MKHAHELQHTEDLAFVDGHLERTVHDDPSQHTTEGFCRQCGQTTDLKCAGCGSVDIQTDATNGAHSSLHIEGFRKLLMDALSRRNSKFYLTCAMIAIGDPSADGISMTCIAKRFGVSRQAISKLTTEISQRLNLPPSQYMKSAESRNAFRNSNRRNSSCQQKH